MCVREEIEVILGLHSTCTMNFITHARTYSLYPRATLDYHASASRFTTDERELEAQVKYRQRGWVPIPRFIVDGDVIHDSTLDFPDVDHFVGDQYTLRWVLGKERSVEALGQPFLEDDDAEVDMDAWTLKYMEPRRKGVVINFAVMKGKMMFKSYCLSDGMLEKVMLHMGNWNDINMKEFVARYHKQTV
ncbi:uncharacterized protein EV420DRAFT_1485589 [Desarmillaria tabescens]|uniref:Uncharacterized protein n=1 Tax=Armillaria tabescens TaxID=1929756 RepID=A0AA39JEY9_ARMTA|nr:uncharacterized protein EV420DRAFT_1485589 [Desarmillaria tabescens]KAK0441517.1 hypothetical protein EV420DRAFT_1485589 [Desarmillaria tabescens]